MVLEKGNLVCGGPAVWDWFKLIGRVEEVRQGVTRSVGRTMTSFLCPSSNCPGCSLYFVPGRAAPQIFVGPPELPFDQTYDPFMDAAEGKHWD